MLDTNKMAVSPRTIAGLYDQGHSLEGLKRTYGTDYATIVDCIVVSGVALRERDIPRNRRPSETLAAFAEQAARRGRSIDMMDVRIRREYLLCERDGIPTPRFLD